MSIKKLKKEDALAGEHLAKKDGVSMSLKMRDLVREALELEEDIALSRFAEERELTFSKAKALKHDEVW